MRTPGLLSVEEYLEYENNSRLRHEYIAGEIFAMTGASSEHNLIAGNVFYAFKGHLQGGPCKTYISGFKIRMNPTVDEIFYYPDVMVACGQEDIEKYYLRNPKLIVEVLSPSTEGVDRKEKFVNYRRGVATLEEYVLVAQDTAEVTIHRRSAAWAPVILTNLDEIAEFQSIELPLRLSRIYDGVL